MQVTYTIQRFTGNGKTVGVGVAHDGQVLSTYATFDLDVGPTNPLGWAEHEADIVAAAQALNVGESRELSFGERTTVDEMVAQQHRSTWAL